MISPPLPVVAPFLRGSKCKVWQRFLLSLYFAPTSKGGKITLGCFLFMLMCNEVAKKEQNLKELLEFEVISPPFFLLFFR